MKKISIIGGTSPLGIDLAANLAMVGHEVLASYRNAARIPASFDSVARTRHLDLAESSDFNAFIDGTVVWLAHIDQGRFNEHETESNIAVFERFLDQAIDSDVEKIVFVSSGGSVYGRARELPIREDHPLDPLSSYGKTKAAMERLLIEKIGSTDISTAILRPGNIYGFSDPNRDNKGIVAAFLHSMTTAQPFTLIHEGRAVRDFIHVEDVVRGIEAAIETNRKNVVWNIATGIGHSTAEVIEKVRSLVDLPMPPVNHVANFTSDVERNILSIERITAESGWLPRISLKDGIGSTVERQRISV